MNNIIWYRIKFNIIWSNKITHIFNTAENQQIQKNNEPSVAATNNNNNNDKLQRRIGQESDLAWQDFCSEIASIVF